MFLHLVWDVPPSLSWSPDSKWLAFPGPETVDYAIAPRAQIYLLNIETLEHRVLPFPSPTCSVALAPAFSRDGNEIASYCQEETFAMGESSLCRDGRFASSNESMDILMA
jgi:hypothetical protein